MAVMPERVELENYRRSSTKAEEELQEESEEPEEVSEETQNWFNLGVNQKHKHSSESEMEEEEENKGGRQRVTSEEARTSWRETLQLHLHLRSTQEGEEVEEEEEEVEGEGEVEEDEEAGGSEVETSDEGDITPLASPAAGCDITCCVTPVDPDSTSTPSSVTPPPCTTPSTASFITTPDSTHDEDRDTAPPTHLTPAVIMETVALRHACRQPAARGRGSFDDISAELPPKKPLHLQERGVELEKEGADKDEEEADLEWVRRGKRHRGAHSLPPRSLLLPLLQGGGGGLLLQLKGLRETLPPGQVEVEGGGARALWRAMFSGNKREKTKRGRSLPPERETANQRRATDVRGGLSLTEESDLDSSTLLQRCSMKPRNNRRSVRDRVPLRDSDGKSSCPTEVVGVLVQPKEPSSMSVKETMFQRGREDEDEALDAKITRRVQRAARRQAKQEQLKRLHKAQMIQRQLQQVEEKQRQLEERGVMVEKALRGEADYWGDSNNSEDVDLHLGGLGRLDNPALMQQWFQLVQQKNSLVRYESELMIFARELELEDRQSRLQQELRERMAVEDHLKEDWQLVEERLILEEMLEVVEQRDSLVSLLEEQRLQERQEDKDVGEVMMARGLGLSWT